MGSALPTPQFALRDCGSEEAVQGLRPQILPCLLPLTEPALKRYGVCIRIRHIQVIDIWTSVISWCALKVLYYIIQPF